ARSRYGRPSTKFGFSASWTLRMSPDASREILATLKGVACPTVYEEKKQLICDMSIALWDVCHTCVRPGSLDSAIRYEEPNAIAKLLQENPSIQAIVFNGQPAEKLFHKHLKSLRHFHCITMPSTSPTNTKPFEEKLNSWKELLELL
ncbi:MAG: DNA-deoxyinosine glycosylase, partial [Bacteroidota bacterium]|nr:DNA-deoxyinosine glycosylase [Bacteroidota bacterium]